MPGLNVEEDCSIFTNEIESIVHNFTKKVKGKKNQKRSLPWLNSEVLKLMKDRDLALKRVLMSNWVNDKRICYGISPLKR